MPYRSVIAPGCGVGPATWRDRMRARWVVRAERIAAVSADFAAGIHLVLLLLSFACFFGAMAMAVASLWWDWAAHGCLLLMVGYVLITLLGLVVCEEAAQRDER